MGGRFERGVARLQRLSALPGVTRASGRPSLGSGLGQPGLAHDGLSALEFCVDHGLGGIYV